MANRKGVFIGAYVPAQTKADLLEAAHLCHRTLSGEVLHRLTLSLYGVTPAPHEVAGGRLAPALARTVEVLEPGTGEIAAGDEALPEHSDAAPSAPVVIVYAGRVPCKEGFVRHRYLPLKGDAQGEEDHPTNCIRCGAPNPNAGFTHLAGARGVATLHAHG
jgi:hypothetical protein